MRESGGHNPPSGSRKPWTVSASTNNPVLLPGRCMMKSYQKTYLPSNGEIYGVLQSPLIWRKNRAYNLVNGTGRLLDVLQKAECSLHCLLFTASGQSVLRLRTHL